MAAIRPALAAADFFLAWSTHGPAGFETAACGRVTTAKAPRMRLRGPIEPRRCAHPDVYRGFAGIPVGGGVAIGSVAPYHRTPVGAGDIGTARGRASRSDRWPRGGRLLLRHRVGGGSRPC